MLKFYRSIKKCLNQRRWAQPQFEEIWYFSYLIPYPLMMWNQQWGPDIDCSKYLCIPMWFGLNTLDKLPKLLTAGFHPSIFHSFFLFFYTNIFWISYVCKNFCYQVWTSFYTITIIMKHKIFTLHTKIWHTHTHTYQKRKYI